MEWLMQIFVEQVRWGEVVWLTQDGQRAGAATPMSWLPSPIPISQARSSWPV
jgi:hypothetical protein